MENRTLKEAAAKINAAKAQSTAVAKTGEKKILAPSVVVGNLIAKYDEAIRQALPSVLTPERFTRIATNAIANNPKLMQAVSESPRTLVAALMTCAQLGIEPNTPLGQGYILPYCNFNKATNRKEMQVNFQLGYQGLIDLCYRSGEVTLIQANVVYAKDDYKYELGLDPVIRHVPYRGADRGEPIAYYGVFKTKNGSTGFAWMWREEVLEHAKQYSKSFDARSGRFFGPWETDFNSMAKKTVLIQALKYAPKKSEFARALLADSTTKSAIAPDMTEVPPDDFIEGEVIPDSEGAPDIGDRPADGDAGQNEKPGEQTFTLD